MANTKKYKAGLKKTIKKLHTFLVAIALLLTATCCRAQLNPLQAIYYQNRYLNNPAMAGLNKGLDINLGYMQQWDEFPGTPKVQLLTAEYQATDKVGLGINITDEQSGIFRETRFMGTYAYHLPLGDENEKLNFGVSIGVSDSRINYSAVNGDLTDIILQQYNQQKPYFDSDLGLSYTSNNLFVEGVLPNLNTTIFNRHNQRQDVDQEVFFTALSYKIDLNDNIGDFSLEPLAAYREIKGFTNIFDAGVNLKMNAYHLDLQTVYHSNNNFGFGVTFNQQNFAVSFCYNVYAGQIANYTNGAFEIGLRLNPFNK